MLHLAVFAATLAAAPARAAGSYADQQKELKTEADVLQALTDIAFLATASRKTDDAATPPTSGQTDADSGADPRLSRPRALSMVYETLAALEYQQAAGGVGADAQVAGRKVSALSKTGSLLIDPKTQTASRSYSRLSARVKAGSAGLTNVGRSTPPVANKKMAALQKSLDAVDVQLADPNTPPAAKAGLHAKAGKIYEDMAGAAALQASVAVVTQSVVDLDAPPSDGTADVPDSGSDHPSARKSSGPRRAMSVAKLQKLAAKVRSSRKGVIVKTKSGAPAARARSLPRAAALRSVYRQLAAADYKSCLASRLPAASKAKVLGGLKRLRVAGEAAAADDAPAVVDDGSAAPDAAPSDCGCPGDAPALGDDSYGLCYCAAQDASAASSDAAQADAELDRQLAQLDPVAIDAARKVSSRETPKAGTRVSAQVQGRYARARAYERMAAAATRPPFSSGRAPTAARLQKVAAQLRSGVGPVTILSAKPKGGYRAVRVSRSLALKRTYQLMAALDYRAALKAGLPAAKTRAAARSLRGLHAAMVRGRVRRKAGMKVADDADLAPDAAADDGSDSDFDVADSSDASDAGSGAAAFVGAADDDSGTDDGSVAADDGSAGDADVAVSTDPYAGTPLTDLGGQDLSADGSTAWSDFDAAGADDGAGADFDVAAADDGSSPDDSTAVSSATALDSLTDPGLPGCADGDDACAAAAADDAQTVAAYADDQDPAAWDDMQDWWADAPAADAGADDSAPTPAKACPPASRVVHSSRHSALCAASAPAGRVAGRKSSRPLFGKLAKLERKASGASKALAARKATRAQKAGLLFQRAQAYQKMAAAIPVKSRKAARKSSKVAGRPAAVKRAVADDAAPDATPAPDSSVTAAPDATPAPNPAPAPAPDATAPAAPSEEDAVKAGEREMEDQSKEMEQQIQQRAAPAQSQ